MDFSIKNFIQILKKQDETFLTMSIYGGEPLINKKNLFKAIEKYKNEYQGIKINWVVNTNGSLLTEKIVDFFKKYDVDVHLSVDGFEEIHNQNRIDKFNKGTFVKAEKALHLIKQKKVRAQINSFVFPENLNNLFDLIGLAKKFDIQRIYLDLFYDTQKRAIHSGILSKKYFGAYKYGLKEGVKISGPWTRAFLGYTGKKQRIRKTPRITVTAEGKFFFGCNPLMEPLDLNNLRYDLFIDNFKKIANQFEELVESNCKYCFLRKSCAGSMINQFRYHTRLNNGWKRSCESAKEIIKLIIKNETFKNHTS